jgi:hypothetical protein
MLEYIVTVVNYERGCLIASWPIIVKLVFLQYSLSGTAYSGKRVIMFVYFCKEEAFNRDGHSFLAFSLPFYTFA